MTPSGNSTGPFADVLLQKTLKDFLGVGADADLPDDVRFLTGVAKLIKKRMELGEIDLADEKPAVFLLHPEPELDGTQATRRIPMLDNGLTRVSGHLWFVNKVANDGIAIKIPTTYDDAEIFQLVALLKAAQVPAVIFDPRMEIPEARYYPDGLSRTDTCHPIRLDGAQITLDQVFEVIDRLHRQQLCTPDVQGLGGKLWGDGRRHRPVENAEDKIQVVLRGGLTGSFPTCVIRAEQVQTSGRLDIEIEEPGALDRSVTQRHAILELKVLRSYRSSGASVTQAVTQEAVTKGVRQAAEYKTDRGSKLAALCCFDMRLNFGGDTCFDHVRDLAQRLVVELRSWHLFASSEAYRRYLTESGSDPVPGGT